MEIVANGIWRPGRELKRLGYLLAVVAIGSLLVRDAAAKSVVGPRGLPPSGRRLWIKVTDPEGEQAARVRILVERLMAKAAATRGDPETRTRLYAATVAVVELARVSPNGARELGFFVGHALVELEQTAGDLSRKWLAAALSECKDSPLAFEGWLDWAKVCARQMDLDGERLAWARAEAMMSCPEDEARFHLERGMSFERASNLRHAELDFGTWARLDVDELSLAQASWHWGIVVDRLGDYATALHIIDGAEARAYERPSDALVAMDVDGFRWASDVDRHYAMGLKCRWLAERRDAPPPLQSLRDALAAFEQVVRSAEAVRFPTAYRHIEELQRQLRW
jgi:hypothetical protein